MSSERHQIASKFRSEGRGEAANINGQKESDVASIQSAATRNALKIEGEADAEAARIYAAAYNSPEAQNLYSFVRRLEVARAAFARETTAIISTESDFGAVLKGIGRAGAEPQPPLAPTRWVVAPAVSADPRLARSNLIHRVQLPILFALLTVLLA
jgi:regulator of protease activity HflC (stomatin/prohibitin superfamily)